MTINSLVNFSVLDRAQRAAKRKLDTKQILRAIRTGQLDEHFCSDLLEQLEDEIAKCDKQIEMLEDAVLVYHMQRAPTRRVWYVDVGQVRPDRAKWIVQEFAKEYESKVINDDYSLNRQEDIYLPVYKDTAGIAHENTRVQDQSAEMSWDGSDLLETFYAKRARLLSLYAGLSVAVQHKDGAEIIKLICNAPPLTSPEASAVEALGDLPEFRRTDPDPELEGKLNDSRRAQEFDRKRKLESGRRRWIGKFEE